MPKGLIIVESPAKAKTISKFLNNEYIVKASMGHVRDLPKKELGVNVDKDFSPHYVLDSGKTKLINELKEAVKKADAIYLASDHDREGEAIAWHLAKVLEKEIGTKPLHRILFNEITAKAIKQSIANPEIIDMAKVDAQQARRVLDRIVGYKVSPLLWKIIAKDLSAGRVQSVALRLICEREDQINAFVPKEFWKLQAEFWKGDLPAFKAVLDKWQGKKIELATEDEALAIVGETKNKDAILSEIKRQNRSVEPPPPFITSTLQQESSKLLGYQAQKTMSIAQELYEGIDLGGEHTGLITYMRTDSVRISEEAIAALKDLIVQRFGKDQLNATTRVFKSKSDAQDAHEAIRPTDPMRTPESIANLISKDQLKLYTLIWQRFTATQMKAVKLLQTTAKISLGPAEFAASGNQIVEEAFLKAYPYVNIPLGEKIDPAYAAMDELMYKNLIHSQHFTSPPSRFTEASLIKELETKGIGRPSTYASIISTIRQRKYVLMEKKAFVPTALGMDVFRFLLERFADIFNVKFTAEMEDKLDKLELEKQAWPLLVKDYYEQLLLLIANVDVKKERSSFTEETDLVCDLCKEAKMVVKRSKRGEFLSCASYPKCKNTKPFERDEKGEIHIKLPQTLEEKCPNCGSALVERNGKFGAFIACSTYPKCKFAKPKSSGMTCPECKEGEIVERRNKQGRTFFSCSTYPKCKWITNDRPVKIECPNCGHPFIFEKYSKSEGSFKECPACKTRMD